jgi:hypothetical protein
MSVIPCQQNEDLRKIIERYIETLKTQAHTLGEHGLSESEFYRIGVLRGAIESMRGEYSATMREKREFARNIFNHMQDRGFIKEWESAGEVNRHDYSVTMPTGRVAVVELKGCMDGNNTLIFERPPIAQEFVIWSLCTNPAGDPRKNAWSGIHTRLSADMIDRGIHVDGVIIWDWTCGSVGRPCPKLAAASERITTVSQYQLPPPCIYLMPATVAGPRTNPRPVAQPLDDVHLLKAFHECFGGKPEEINHVDFEVEYRGADTVRRTVIRRNGEIVKESKLTPIRRGK